MFKTRVRNLLAISLGAAVMGFGLNYFNLANNLAEGGVTGISLLLRLAWGVDPGLSYLLINVPIFLVGWLVLGRKPLLYTLYGILALSFFLTLFGKMRLPLEDLLLAALFGGSFVGLGLGVVFRFGGTTGGADIVARILNKKWGWSMGRTLFLADLLVVACSLVYLRIEQAMYTVVAVFVGARVIDFVQEGAYAAKALTIVSAQTKAIAARVLAELERGATILHGQGAYTGQQRDVLYVVVARSELVRLKELIHEVDAHAFLTVSDVHEVLGEGFTLDAQKRPLQD